MTTTTAKERCSYLRLRPSLLIIPRSRLSVRNAHNGMVDTQADGGRVRNKHEGVL